MDADFGGRQDLPPDLSAGLGWQVADLGEQVLSQLAPRDRLVLTLMYLEEQSVDEIAEATGWSRSMVKVQAWRARKRLKRLLESL